MKKGFALLFCALAGWMLSIAAGLDETMARRFIRELAAVEA